VHRLTPLPAAAGAADVESEALLLLLPRPLLVM
jgi:hypothetical protein